MQMNLPNKLTMLRVIMKPIFVVVLLSGLVPMPLNRYIATIIFMAASFTDYLDGHLQENTILLLISVNLWTLWPISFWFLPL